MSRVAQELASVPIADMITSLGVGIARAQFELDQTSADIARMMSGVNPEDRVLFGGQYLSLLELGFTPTFYQFIESTIEIKMVVSMSSSSSTAASSKSKSASTGFSSSWSWWRGGARVNASTRTVDAKYSNKYDYSVEGSSLVRTKLVPVPPPAILEERIRGQMEAEAAVRYQAELRKLLARHRGPVLNSINQWNKRLSPQDTISSVGDLQKAILSLNPAFREIALDYPDIMADATIVGALQSRFALYMKQREGLQNSVLREIENWTLNMNMDRVYPNQAAFERELQTDMSASVRTRLSYEAGLLDSATVRRQLDQTFADYQQALAEKLASELASFTPDINIELSGPNALVAEFLQSQSLLQQQIQPYPAVLVNPVVESAAEKRYEDWLNRLMVSKLDAWDFPAESLPDGEAGYFNQFLLSHPSLSRQLSAFPGARSLNDFSTKLAEKFAGIADGD